MLIVGWVLNVDSCL
jgi:chromosome segregation ATPase